MIILMCDGSSAGNPGLSKIGIVMWKRSFEKTQRTTPDKIISQEIGVGTNNDAEWQAVLKGLEICQDCKQHPVFIYTDSMLVVMQANEKWKIKEPRMREYKVKYDNLKQGFLNVTITWLPRQLTVLADKQT
jgi:ribonuclease HI